MDIIDISRNQLLRELYESKKMIYRILNLSPEVQSVLFMSLSPFLSLLCNSIDDLFSSEDIRISDNYADIEGISFSKMISKNRASVKLLTDKKLTKATKIIDQQLVKFNEILQNDYSLIQRIYIKVFGQPDLGVYFYNNIPIANTSQLSIYQDEFRGLDISNSKIGPTMGKFSEYQASLINSILTLIEGIECDEIEQKSCVIDILKTDFKEKDFIIYNDKKRNVFFSMEDKNYALYLFNIQCQLNFASELIPKIILNNSLGYRFEMIIYYHSAKSIDFIYRKKKELFASNIFPEIDEFIKQFNQIFSNNSLRNNLYHYKLSEDNKNMEMNDDWFVSMVEFQTNKSFDLIINIVRNEILKLISIIEKVIT